MRVRAARGRKRLVPASVDIDVGERPANLRSILRTSNNSYSNETDYSRCASFGRIVKIRLIPPRPDAIPGKVTVLEADDSSSVKDLVFLDPIAPESIVPYTTCAPCASDEKTSFEYQAFSDPEVRSCLLESPLGDNNLEEEESDENTITTDTSPVNSSEDINSCDVANGMSPTTSTADNTRNICVSVVDIGNPNSTLPVYSSSNSFSPCASLKKLNIVGDSPAHKCRRRSVKFTVPPGRPNWEEVEQPQSEESTVATVKPQNVTREKPAVKNNRRRSHYFPPPEQDRIAHLEDSEMPVLEVMTGNCSGVNPVNPYPTPVEEDVTQSTSSEISIVDGGEQETTSIPLSVSVDIQQELAQPSCDLVMKGKKRGRSTCISMPPQQPALIVLQQDEEPDAENLTNDVRPEPTIDSQNTGTTGYSLRPRKAALQNDSTKPVPSRTGRGRRGRPDITKTRVLEQEQENESNPNTGAPSSVEIPIAQNQKLAEAQASGVISQENTSSEKMVTKDTSVHVVRKSRRSCVLKPANKDFHRTLFDVEANEIQQL